MTHRRGSCPFYAARRPYRNSMKPKNRRVESIDEARDQLYRIPKDQWRGGCTLPERYKGKVADIVTG
jgi:hypothetical protein